MKKSPTEASLLLVDDDPTVIQVLSKILSDYTTVRFATSGADALRLAKEERPDLILLDAQMNDMSGLQVCESLKVDPVLADIPVVFVSSLQESELEVAVLEMGAVDFIRKPFTAAQVTARVNMQLKLKRLADDLRQLSRVDALTGLPDERAFGETLRRELLRAAEAKQSLSLVLLDIDFFRSFEALYGRKATEGCLVQLADTLRSTLARPGDFAARIDGDHFALVLPDTAAEAGAEVANRVLGAVEALDIAHQGSNVSRHITCSAGLSSFDGAAVAEPDAAAVGQALRAAAAGALAQARDAGHAQAATVALRLE